MPGFPRLMQLSLCTAHYAKAFRSFGKANSRLLCSMRQMPSLEGQRHHRKPVEGYGMFLSASS
jgi:hypothetical protein